MEELDDIDKELLAAAESVRKASQLAQKEIYDAVRAKVDRLDTIGGKFDSKSNPNKVLSDIEASFGKILKKDYEPSIFDYLQSIFNATAKVDLLHKKRNNVGVRKGLFEEAKDILTNRVTDSMLPIGNTFTAEYTQSIKNLIYLKAKTGATIQDMRDSIRAWNKGDFTTANNPTQRPVPSLDGYINQLSRDVAFQHNGTVNQMIAEEYELNGFEYSGSIISSTRPLCAHLVKLDRPILFSELPALLVKYPEGVIKGTNAKNFATYRGGWACRHRVFPVRIE